MTGVPSFCFKCESKCRRSAVFYEREHRFEKFLDKYRACWVLTFTKATILDESDVLSCSQDLNRSTAFSSVNCVSSPVFVP